MLRTGKIRPPKECVSCIGACGHSHGQRRTSVYVREDKGERNFAKRGTDGRCLASH